MKSLKMQFYRALTKQTHDREYVSWDRTELAGNSDPVAGQSAYVKIPDIPSLEYLASQICDSFMEVSTSYPAIGKV